LLTITGEKGLEIQTASDHYPDGFRGGPVTWHCWDTSHNGMLTLTIEVTGAGIEFKEATNRKAVIPWQ
jgi:hypothetical protein